jgi:CHRD domain/Bacterial Ig domain
MRNMQLVSGALLLILTACGGGYGGGGGGSGGGMGCGGAYQPVCPAPTVTLTAPASGAMVSGTIALTATASASTAYGLTVSKVDFMIDGTPVGTATTSPYTVMWNSATVTATTHMVTAKVTDSVNDTAMTSPISITTTGHAALTVTMTSAQIFPTPSSSASGTAHITVKLETGAMRGTVMLSGLTATAVSINDGFAGATGPRVITLVANGGTAGEWDVPAGALLTAEQLGSLGQGKLYVIASSARHPNGEIRGQLVPESIVVTFSELTASPAARALGITASGMAATTVDAGSGTVTVHLNVHGVDDAMAAQLLGAAGAAGGPLAALVKDSVDMGHWSTELAGLSTADVAAFRAGQWSVRVATPTLPESAVEAAIEAGRSGPSD